jgi:lipopolysaccharide export system protein LptA
MPEELIAHQLMDETRMHNTALRPLVWLIVLFMHTTQLFALPEDRMKIVHVQANTADINQQTHEGIYDGDVALDQGSTHVRAAHARTVGNDKNKLILAVITGNKTAQAHCWTQIQSDKPPLHAFADTIKYYPERHLIELIGHARVEQGRHSFSAPFIRYDTLAQHVISKPHGSERTTILFYPESAS